MEGTNWHLLNPLDVVGWGENEHPSVWLGRIVKEFNCPVNNHVSSSNIVAVHSDSKNSFTQSGGHAFHFVDYPDFTDVQGLIDRAKSSRSSLQLSDFMAAIKTKRSTQTPSFSSSKVRLLRIEQEDDAIKSILNDNVVQEKLKDWVTVTGSRAYLIAAILVTEVEIEYDEISSTEIKSNIGVGVPATLVSGAASALAAAPVVAQDPISAGRAQSERTASSFRATIKGPKIIAIDYRVLRRPLWSFSHQVVPTRKPPRSGRLFGPKATRESEQEAELLRYRVPMASKQETELPDIIWNKDPLYSFEKDAIENGFTLEE